MESPDKPKPPVEWLAHLCEAQRWDQLAEVAKQSLEADPHDELVHWYAGWAYARLGRLSEMVPHIEFLLRENPNGARNHYLAAIFHSNSGRQQKAWKHIRQALEIEPDVAAHHFMASTIAIRAGERCKAIDHARRAREIDPQCAHSAHLEICLDATVDSQSSGAWERLKRLNEARSLDPDEGKIVESIGDIYLWELDMPNRAVEAYRAALALNCTKGSVEARLIYAIAARSSIYRALLLPYFAARYVRNWHGTSWMYLLGPLFIVFWGWCLVACVLFYPARWLYEIGVIDGLMPPDRRRFPWMRWFFKFPIWIRSPLALGLGFSSWGMLIATTSWMELPSAILLVTAIFVCHYGIVCLFCGLRRVRVLSALWRFRRLEKKREADSQFMPGTHRKGAQ